MSFSRANEIREKTEKLQDEVGNLDMDLEEHHGTPKYFILSKFKFFSFCKKKI